MKKPLNKAVLILLLIVVCLAIFSVLYKKSFGISGFSSRESVLISTHIDPEYIKVAPGGEISLGISVVRIGGADLPPKDIEVRMFSVDENGEKILLSSQTAAIGTQISLILHDTLPKSTKSKSALIYVEVVDSDSGQILGTTSQRIIVAGGFYFRVSNDPLAYFIAGAVIIFVTFILTMLVVRFKWHHEREAIRRRRHKEYLNKKK